MRNVILSTGKRQLPCLSALAIQNRCLFLYAMLSLRQMAKDIIAFHSVNFSSVVNIYRNPVKYECVHWVLSSSHNIHVWVHQFTSLLLFQTMIFKEAMAPGVWVARMFAGESPLNSYPSSPWGANPRRASRDPATDHVKVSLEKMVGTLCSAACLLSPQCFIIFFKCLLFIVGLFRSDQIRAFWAICSQVASSKYLSSHLALKCDSHPSDLGFIMLCMQINTNQPHLRYNIVYSHCLNGIAEAVTEPWPAVSYVCIMMITSVTAICF